MGAGPLSLPPLLTLDGDLARCASEMKVRTIEVTA